jgi:IS30 family transposase
MFRRTRVHRVSSRGQIADGISIRERPAEIEDRAVHGHWEGDLISGTNNSAIATVVERKSRFTVLCRVKNRKASSIVTALTDQMQRLPQHLLKSLTWDRGQEMSAHKAFTIDTDMMVYFCDPSSPWPRGINENTNGLLLQYFPKGRSIGIYNQSQLNEIAPKVQVLVSRTGLRPQQRSPMTCRTDSLNAQELIKRNLLIAPTCVAISSTAWR